MLQPTAPHGQAIEIKTSSAVGKGGNSEEVCEVKRSNQRNLTNIDRQPTNFISHHTLMNDPIRSIIELIEAGNAQWMNRALQ